MRNTVSFYTLGCKLNHVETDALAQRFVERGFRVVEFSSSGECVECVSLVVINSCTVTITADAECRQVISKAKKSYPNAEIVVTGCYAERDPEALRAIPGVTHVVGNDSKHLIADIANLGDLQRTAANTSYSDLAKETSSPFESLQVPSIEFHAAVSFGSSTKTRAFLKLQDGCDYSCTFCTIPAVRGAARAMPFENVHKQIVALTESGCKEVVLTGVNLGEYKAPSGERFVDVLRAFHNAQPPFRVRISSIEPNTVSDEIIDLVAASNIIAPHFHLPLQSGSAEVLRNMKRRYNPDRYRSVVERILERIPDACIGIDVITGFPGETDALFTETYEFLEKLAFAYLHVFTYSERPGTPAAEMKGAVPHRTRKHRTHVLGQLSIVKKNEFYERNIGSTRTVLPEQYDNASGTWEGWTENYLRVKLPGSETMTKQFHKIQI